MSDLFAEIREINAFFLEASGRTPLMKDKQAMTPAPEEATQHAVNYQQELDAIVTICLALEPIPLEGRERILAYVMDRLDISEPRRPRRP